MKTQNDFWIDERILQLHKLMISFDYKGNDPFDLLNSPYLKHVPNWNFLLLVINKFGSRITPDNFRKILRVPPIEDPKIYACAYFGYKLLGGKKFSSFADLMIDRLIGIATHDDFGTYWGYDYTWPTFTGVNQRGASTIVPGSFAILAFLYETISSKRKTHIPIIRQALNFYGKQHLCQNSTGRFLGYFAHSKSNNHNANLLGCAALSFGAKILGDDEWFNIAAEATSTTLHAINDNGFLPYNDHPSGSWTDSYHHLYIIASLYLISRVNPLSDHDRCSDAIEKLRRYYKANFIREDGLINYYPNQLYPIDCHNYAAAVIFGILFDSGQLLACVEAKDLLARIDALTWNSKDQRYLHRLHKKRKDKRFFLRWNQVWMFLAFCLALEHNKSLINFNILMKQI